MIGNLITLANALAEKPSDSISTLHECHATMETQLSSLEQ